MRALVGVVLVAGTSAMVHAQDHQGCPMHKAHGDKAQVDHRHESTTGVPSDATEHHFVLSKDGGSIRLEVKDASRKDARDRIRVHLQGIARSFAAGDFSVPMQIHQQAPPGVEVMEARKASIRYSYADSAKGGVVTISTADPEARSAVHEFLRFQIRDHGTGDPTERR